MPRRPLKCATGTAPTAITATPFFTAAFFFAVAVAVVPSVRGSECELTLPARSEAVASILCSPAVRPTSVADQEPDVAEPVAWLWPST
jgi:hypothetical protein